MKQIAHTLITLALVGSLLNQGSLAQQSNVRTQNIQPHPINLDFEQGTTGAVPDGWICPTKGYVAQLV